jgi:hypothetical protein
VRRSSGHRGCLTVLLTGRFPALKPRIEAIVRAAGLSFDLIGTLGPLYPGSQASVAVAQTHRHPQSLTRRHVHTMFVGLVSLVLVRVVMLRRWGLLVADTSVQSAPRRQDGGGQAGTHCRAAAAVPDPPHRQCVGRPPVPAAGIWRLAQAAALTPPTRPLPTLPCTHNT